MPRECEKQNLLSLVEKEVLHYGTGDTDATLELPSARHGQLRTSYCKRTLGMCTAGGGVGKEWMGLKSLKERQRSLPGC